MTTLFVVFEPEPLLRFGSTLPGRGDISGRYVAHIRILNIGTKGAVTGWTEDAIASFFGRDIVGLEPAEPTQRVAFPGILLLLARQEK